MAPQGITRSPRHQPEVGGGRGLAETALFMLCRRGPDAKEPQSELYRCRHQEFAIPRWNEQREFATPCENTETMSLEHLSLFTDE